MKIPVAVVQGAVIFIVAFAVVSVLVSPSIIGWTDGERNAFLFGIILTLLVMALVLPDQWGIWWCQIENAPVWMKWGSLPVFIATGFIVLFLGFGGALLDAISRMWVHPVVAALLAISGIVLVLSIVFSRRKPAEKQAS